MVLSSKRFTNGILSLICFFILLEPPYFKQIQFIDNIFKVSQIVIFFVGIYFYFVGKKKSDRISKIVVVMIVYHAVLIVVTVLNGGLVLQIGYQALQFCCFAIYLDMVLINNPKMLFRTCMPILEIYLVLNFFTIIFCQEGLYRSDTFVKFTYYFLGYDNQNINFILPALVLVLIYSVGSKGHRLHLIFCYCVAILTAIQIWSGMTLIVVCTMSFLAVICLKKNNYFIEKILSGNWFNGISLLWANIVMNISIVILRLQYLLEFLIVDILQKDITLTGRTVLWDRNFYYIFMKPCWGYGVDSAKKRALKLGYSASAPQGLHAHNRFVETLYRGGFVLFGIYLWMLFYAAKCLKKFKNERISKILAFSIFIYLGGMITEFYDYCIFFWGFLVMSERVNNIIDVFKN